VSLGLLYQFDPLTERRLVASVRSARTAIAATSVIADYSWTLKYKALLFDQPDYLDDKAKCHQRSANKLLALFKTNGYSLSLQVIQVEYTSN